jgi:hypothetical protein
LRCGRVRVGAVVTTRRRKQEPVCLPVSALQRQWLWTGLRRAGQRCRSLYGAPHAHRNACAAVLPPSRHPDRSPIAPPLRAARHSAASTQAARQRPRRRAVRLAIADNCCERAAVWELCGSGLLCGIVRGGFGPRHACASHAHLPASHPSLRATAHSCSCSKPSQTAHEAVPDGHATAPLLPRVP